MKSQNFILRGLYLADCPITSLIYILVLFDDVIWFGLSLRRTKAFMYEYSKHCNTKANIQTLHDKYRVKIRLRLPAISSKSLWNNFFSFFLFWQKVQHEENLIIEFKMKLDTVRNHDVIAYHSTRLEPLVQKSNFTIPPVVVIVEESISELLVLSLHGFLFHSNLWQFYIFRNAFYHILVSWENSLSSQSHAFYKYTGKQKRSLCSACFQFCRREAAI